MPQIPSLSGSYIDETYQRLVQVSGSSFADGDGNPITFGTIDTGSLLTTSSFNSWTGSSLSQFSGTASYALTASARGINQSVQYNKNGVLGGDIYFLYNDTNQSLTQGGSNFAGGSYSHAQGTGTVSTGQSSHAEGSATLASGPASHAEGETTTASGNASHAEGLYTGASGDYSHTEGNRTNAIGEGSHTEGAGYDVNNQVGVDTTTITYWEFGDGVNPPIYAGSVVGSNPAAFALPGNQIGLIGEFPFNCNYFYLNDGVHTVTVNINYYPTPIIAAANYDSFNDTTEISFNPPLLDNYQAVSGSGTYAYGNYSHVEGISNISVDKFQHVNGQYNLAVSGAGAFIIGNGGDENNRSNLLYAAGNEVQITGSVLVQGDIIPGGPYTANTSSYSLGSPTAAWKDIYVSNGSLIFISGSTSSSINLGTDGVVNLTGSLQGTATTSSYVNTLNQNVIITGSVAIGTGSVGTGESNLVLGPAPAGGTGEGGQIALLAAGGSYTSSSFIDNWQNQFRILRGPGATSNAGLVYVDLQSGNTQFVGAVTASGFSGLPNSWLHALRSGNQTIGSGTWASRDIIFNEVSSINFTYNSTTGIATLKANKTYRLTARIAWSAAGLYTLKFRVYNQTTSAFTGPTVEMIQSPNGTYNVSDNTLEHILAVGASDIDISIRTTSDTNALTGEYIRGDLNTQLIIQQIA